MALIFRLGCILLSLGTTLFLCGDLCRLLGIVVEALFPETDTVDVIACVIASFLRPILDAQFQCVAARLQGLANLFAVAGLFLLVLTAVMGLACLISLKRDSQSF